MSVAILMKVGGYRKAAITAAGQVLEVWHQPALPSPSVLLVVRQPPTTKREDDDFIGGWWAGGRRRGHSLNLN